MPNNDVIRVAIVEDSASLREELVRMLSGLDGFACVAACCSAEDALRLIPAAAPNVILMDIRLPGASGVACVRALRERLPDAQIMMLTVVEEADEIFQSIAAGATGYLLKSQSLARLPDAIRELNEGGSPMTSSIARRVLQAFGDTGPATSASGDVDRLTDRERQVLELVARGRRNKEVAHELGVSPRTIDAYLHRIYLKLHVRDKAGALARFGSGTDRGGSRRRGE